MVIYGNIYHLYILAKFVVYFAVVPSERKEANLVGVRLARGAGANSSASASASTLIMADEDEKEYRWETGYEKVRSEHSAVD